LIFHHPLFIEEIKLFIFLQGPTSEKSVDVEKEALNQQTHMKCLPQTKHIAVSLTFIYLQAS
jgi:hypothetical protein